MRRVNMLLRGKGRVTAYPFEIIMNDILVVKVLETTTHVHQLRKISKGVNDRHEEQTSLNRTEGGLSLPKSQMVPFSIHGDIRHHRSLSRVTP